jgi:hypothetical protein
MKKQTAVIVNPAFGGTTSLDLSQLKPPLNDGWLVNSTCASSNGAILVTVPLSTRTHRRLRRSQTAAQLPEETCLKSVLIAQSFKKGKRSEQTLLIKKQKDKMPSALLTFPIGGGGERGRGRLGNFK